MADGVDAWTTSAWDAVAGGATAATPPRRPVVTGATGTLPSRLPVDDAAAACVAAALQAAAALTAQGGRRPPEVTLDRRHVAAAVTSERHLRRRGVPAGAGFAPLSRFWPAADGWVRTHANFPWHRAALLDALGTGPDEEAVGAALRSLPAEEVEDRVVAAGGVAAAVRSVEAWRSHPQGRAVATEALVGHEVVGAAPPRQVLREGVPAAGVRVLDLTRVIAGPVCTRFLGALGATVLRLDPPGRPDLPHGAVADTLLAKRSALVDLATERGRATVEALLPSADVVVCGYRPGALDRYGLEPRAVAERHPGVVVVALSAWGHHGPWAGRRGFDSVVQAPTGIAALESGGDGEPGALPCQLLDHGTGYLAAAAALDGLRRQRADGGSHVRRLSLARTAHWLTSSPVEPGGGQPGASRSGDVAPWLVDLDSVDGPVTVVSPPGALDGAPLRWPSPVTGYGLDRPAWLDP